MTAPGTCHRQRRDRDVRRVKVAIVEIVNRFWRSPRLNAVSREELLREAGARITS